VNYLSFVTVDFSTRQTPVAIRSTVLGASPQTPTHLFVQATKSGQKMPARTPAENPFTIKKDRQKNSLRKTSAQTVFGSSLFLL